MNHSLPGNDSASICDVTLTFDNFGESFDLLKHGYAGGAFADGAYAPRKGVPRILDLLDKYGISATFFVEGWNIRKYADLAREVVNRGHEVAAHGWMHEQWDALEPGAEQDAIERTTDALTEVLGHSPRGWRSPGGLVTPRTIELLKQAGYQYDSSFGDEDQPYTITWGIDNIVELPWQWSLDDAMYYAPSRTPANPNAVADIWIDEYDAARKITGNFMLVCHPRYSGRPARIGALERLLVHITTTGEAAFKTCSSVATDVENAKSGPSYSAPENLKTEDQV